MFSSAPWVWIWVLVHIQSSAEQAVTYASNASFIAVSLPRNQPFYYFWDHVSRVFELRTKELPTDAASLRKNFHTAPPSLPFKSHSQQQLQDMLVLELLQDKSEGYFVDLAANDWSHLSNSFVLEYYNRWRGVCIEPDPQYLVGLLANRKCTIFVNPVSSANGDRIKFNFGGVYGGIVGNDFDNKNAAHDSVDMYTVTLESILDLVQAPQIIDYMSLDVEGAEWHVLSHFNFSKHIFLVMTIERPNNQLHHLLVRHGYRFVYVISEFGECLYLHHTMSTFDRQMNKRHIRNTLWGGQNHRYLAHPKWNGTYFPVAHEGEDLDEPTSIEVHHHDGWSPTAANQTSSDSFHAQVEHPGHDSQESILTNFSTNHIFTAKTIADHSDLFDMMEAYIRQHNANSVLTDTEFCSRKFVIATYACPQMIGNHMNEFLNAFVAAIVTNRTVVWKFCSRKPCLIDSASDCREYLDRAPWIVSWFKVKNKWERACSALYPKANLFGDIPIVEIYRKNVAHHAIMCCGIDRIVEPFINVGTLEMHEMVSLRYKHAKLSSSSRETVQLLFKYGEDFAYGMLFRWSFAFQQHIKERNDQVIKQMLRKAMLEDRIADYSEKTPFYIGVHLRHSGANDHVGYEHGEEQCLESLVRRAFSKVRQQHFCVVLLATDRQQPIKQHQSGNWSGCLVVTSNHSAVSAPLVRYSFEHGPFIGPIAMHDIELLSRSDVFIGSSYTSDQKELKYLLSTFSTLISGLRATNGGNYSTAYPSYWLPHCSKMLAARLDVRAQESMASSFKCPSNAHDNNFFANYCPYYYKIDHEVNVTDNSSTRSLASFSV